jgi:integrase
VSRAKSSLELYKRHAADCTVHKLKRPLEPKALKFYFECDCYIWIVGRTPNGDIVPRQSTGETDLKKAEAKRATYLRAAKSDPTLGDTVAECVSKHLATKQRSMKKRTHQQNTYVLNRLVAYCLEHGKVYMQQLDTNFIEEFIVAGFPGIAVTTLSTYVNKLRSFLAAAQVREWMHKPMLLKQLERVPAVYEEKEPYTDHELDLIWKAAGELRGGIRGYAKYPETFVLLLDFMKETGLRCGDAVNFDPSVLRLGVTGELWVYTFEPEKQKIARMKKTVDAYLSHQLKAAIDTCAWMSPTRPFKYVPLRPPADPSYWASEVYYRMQAIGKRCGVFDCRPHRLRDTYAVRKLTEGLGISDVSRLLGHSSVDVTERHYNKWVRDRAERLERLVADSRVYPDRDGRRDRQANIFPLSGPGVVKPKYTGLVGKLPRNRVSGPAPEYG